MSMVVNSAAYAGGRRVADVEIENAMKKLTGWAAIFAVPTMIAGIYGMNFRWMPELEHPFGYPAIMGLMLGACGFRYLQFKRSGWL